MCVRGNNVRIVEELVLQRPSADVVALQHVDLLLAAIQPPALAEWLSGLSYPDNFVVAKSVQLSASVLSRGGGGVCVQHLTAAAAVSAAESARLQSSERLDSLIKTLLQLADKDADEVVDLVAAAVTSLVLLLADEGVAPLVISNIPALVSESLESSTAAARPWKPWSEQQRGKQHQCSICHAC